MVIKETYLFHTKSWEFKNFHLSKDPVIYLHMILTANRKGQIVILIRVLRIQFSITSLSYICNLKVIANG